MNYFIDISTIVIQALIFFQDLKYRAVHYILFIVLFILGGITFFNTNSSIDSLLLTYSYIFICLLTAYLYFVLKNKKLVNPFKKVIGIGDILYFIAVIPFFNLSGFIIYFIGGLIFSMILFLVLKKLSSKTITTIPLAGFLALFFVIYKITDVVGISNLFHTNLF